MKPIKAAIALWLIVAILPKPAAAQTAAAAAQAACYRNPTCTGVVVLTGILYLVINGQNVQYDDGYLEDPEAESEEWSDYVWADNLQEARAKCQAIAQANQVAVVEVTHIRGKSYECKFRTWNT